MHLNHAVAGAAGNLGVAEPVDPQDGAVVSLQLLHTAVVGQGPDLDGGVRASRGQQSVGMVK